MSVTNETALATYSSEAICGKCGTNQASRVNGYCVNGHDYWIEELDFTHPDLKDYVKRAAQNLQISVYSLKTHVKTNTSVPYPKVNR